MRNRAIGINRPLAAAALALLAAWPRSAAADPLNSYLIFSAGNIQIGVGTDVFGKIGAGGNVSMNGTSSLTGDMQAGGNVSLANGVQVVGNITNPGTFSAGAGTTYTSRTAAAPSLPASLPGTFAFIAGGASQSVGNGGTLSYTPGVYGAATLGGAATLNLTGAGNYYFTSISAGNGLDLNINAAGGMVRIIVQGRVNFGGSDVTVTGGDWTSVYLETHFVSGALAAFNSGGGTDWVGTIYAPFGNIHIGSGSGPGSVTGRLISGTLVDLEHGLTVTPSPGTAALLAMAGALGLRRRR